MTEEKNDEVEREFCDRQVTDGAVMHIWYIGTEKYGFPYLDQYIFPYRVGICAGAIPNIF